MSSETKFCNNEENQKQLNIHNKPTWETCNMDVHTALMGDWTTNMGLKIPAVLKAGKTMLVYSGDYDFVCNWRGGEAWTKAIEWEHKEDFNNKSYDKWIVDGKKDVPAGQVRQIENLTFLRVHAAGHMVPLDQGRNAFVMFQDFISKETTPEIISIE